MGQAFYRKYRSKSLAEVVGQEHITKTLAGAIKAGHISHAYLFTGPRGVGKTSVARILAHEINNLAYDGTTHLDIIEIDAASNRRIDDIRELREKVHIAPVKAKYKVYIIDEVHMLTGESFNALLKTLEEPPAHVIFILATTEFHKLPATIISRTQRFSFKNINQNDASTHLLNIAEKEGIDITPEAIDLIVEHGDGSFRDSIGLLDQLANIKTDKINEDDVANILGLAPNKQLNDLISASLSGDQTTVGDLLTSLEGRGTQASTLAMQIAKKLTKDARQNPSVYKLIDQLLEVPKAYNPHLKLLATLMLFCEPKAKSAGLAVNSPVQVVAEAPAAPQQKEVEAPANSSKTATPKPEAPEPTKPVSVGDQDLNEQSWQDILTSVAAYNPPLHSLIKYSQFNFDADTQTITLAFKYALHRKKMEDPKQRAALAKVIYDKTGVSASVVIVDQMAQAAPIKDPQLKSVTDIMGGGELIDAQPI